MTEEDGETALQIAVSRHLRGCIRYLLQCIGFPIDPTYPWMAQFYRSDMTTDMLSMLSTLVTPGNASVSEENGMLPLHWAGRSHSGNTTLALLKRILEAYPKAAELPDKISALSIHVEAIRNQCRPAFLTLLIYTYPEELGVQEPNFMLLPMHAAPQQYYPLDEDDNDVNILNFFDPSGRREMSQADGREAILSILYSRSSTQHAKSIGCTTIFPL